MTVKKPSAPALKGSVAERTDRAAREILDTEKEARDRKTEALRAQRLKKEATDRKAGNG